MSTFQKFLSSEFPRAEISEISGSNNQVFLVKDTDEITVAKHVTDTDIPLRYLAECNKQIAESLPVQKIHHVMEKDSGDPFDAVFSEYVEGENLSTALASSEEIVNPQTTSDFFQKFISACRGLPRMHEEFGLYKREAPTFETHHEFVQYYAQRYWGRVRPFYKGTSVGRAIDDWANHGLASSAKRKRSSFSVVSIDTNLKNFVVTADNQITVLNVPIAGYSSPAHAIGAVGTHLRNLRAHGLFLEKIENDVSSVDLEMAPHFELWGLLGIMSFYATRQPENHPEWRNWGSPVTLDEDLKNLAEKILEK